MMKVQLIDRSLIGSSVIEGKAIHTVYRGENDLAIVAGVHSRTLHCYKCSLLSDASVQDTCEHIKLVRKAQNQMAAVLPEQPVDRIVYAIDELITAMQKDASNDQHHHLANARGALTDFKNATMYRHSPVNGA